MVLAHQVEMNNDLQTTCRKDYVCAYPSLALYPPLNVMAPKKANTLKSLSKAIKHPGS